MDHLAIDVVANVPSADPSSTVDFEGAAVARPVAEAVVIR